MADEARDDARQENSDASATVADGAAARRRVEQLRGDLSSLNDGVRFTERYASGSELGVGGMGEVRVISDRRIGRDIAMKVLRPGEVQDGALWRRFLREARVQGQLEHPSIVPVYDVGLDPQGRPYFTMKRIRGMTLRGVLAALAAEEEAALLNYSRHKLLEAFSRICLTIDYAHSRGVVHRDLKPANLMLGDFGEVYVLDWGLAKVIGFDDETSEDWGRISHSDVIQTEHGVRLGTPGYMAPEQVLGTSVDERADVYALGVILYELLTHEPLHRGTAHERHGSTITGIDFLTRFEEAKILVPPELQDAVVLATRPEPGERLESARELYEWVERYLAGDRDLAKRRELAETHAEEARSLRDAALGGGEGSHDARREALVQLSRALALDPQNEGAMRTFVGLVTEPPKVPPPEVQEELEAHVRRTRSSIGRAMVMAALGWFLFAPFWLTSRAVDFEMAIAINAAWALAMVVQAQVSKMPRPSALTIFVPVTLWCGAIVLLSRTYGPFVITPVLAAVIAASFALAHDRPRRIMITLLATSSIALPAVLEWTGLIAPSYEFSGGEIHIVPRVHDFSEGRTRLSLLLANMACVALPALFFGRFRDNLLALQLRQFVTNWHMLQFLPKTGEDAAPRSDTPPGAIHGADERASDDTDPTASS